MNNACTQRWWFDPLPSLWYLAFERHLEEIRLGLIWRRNRQDYGPTPKSLEDYAYRAWRRRRKHKATPDDLRSDDVSTLVMPWEHG
ncbi:hypothetical protein Tco_0869025 [Tanacetum coccineum]